MKILPNVKLNALGILVLVLIIRHSNDQPRLLDADFGLCLHEAGGGAAQAAGEQPAADEGIDRGGLAGAGAAEEGRAALAAAGGRGQRADSAAAGVEPARVSVFSNLNYNCFFITAFNLLVSVL